MDRQRIGRFGGVVAVLALLACGGNKAAPSPPGEAQGGDRLEPGLQGQIPLSAQLSGDSAGGYRKGLRLVGGNDILRRGANMQLAWIGDCAYVTTTSGQQLFGLSDTPYVFPMDFMLNGMAVIDASNPRQPELVDILQSPVMLRPHESLQAHAGRRIIVATSSFGTLLEIWDASDCRRPVLRTTLNLATGLDLPLDALDPALNGNLGQQFAGHALCLSPDGRMAYATGEPISNVAVDLSDLNHPRVLSIFTPAAHDCGVSPDGQRLYLAAFSGLIFGTTGTGLSLLTSTAGTTLDALAEFGAPSGVTDLLADYEGDQNLVGGYDPQLGSTFSGLIIADVSDFHAGRPQPQIGTVGLLEWTPLSENENPNAGSHTTREFRRNGRRYLYSSDEWPLAGEFIACPWGHGRIIDITDEADPVEVADIALEVHDPLNCAQTSLDLVNYSAHYVGIDNPDDARLLFTTWYGAGLRVHDISDPTQPVEIAYWHPAPLGDVALAGSSFAFGATPTWDAVTSYVRYRPETGHIWISAVNAGFQILELTASAVASPAQ